MIHEEKLIDQARGYAPLPCFDAFPMEGPGRWAKVADNLVIYTNDKTVLCHQDTTPGAWGLSPYTGWWSTQISHAHDAGMSATEAFDRLTADYDVVVGDLAEIAER
ncbi:MAG: hypothetical protein QM662_11100 [Gordonia sp. (in: high G+C Gram-positive bacteria)]